MTSDLLENNLVETCRAQMTSDMDERWDPDRCSGFGKRLKRSLAPNCLIFRNWSVSAYIGNNWEGSGSAFISIKKVTLERLSYTHFLAIFLLIDQSLTGFEPWWQMFCPPSQKAGSTKRQQQSKHCYKWTFLLSPCPAMALLIDLKRFKAWKHGFTNYFPSCLAVQCRGGVWG